MRFADVVEASERVAATSSRTEKTAVLADLLSRLEPGDVTAAVGFLTGEARQGRIGVGWATLRDVEASHADVPSLTLTEVDEAFEAILRTTGAGSVEARRELLDGIFGRATGAEASFLERLFGGELRQGALEGVMVEAVARAADVPARLVRRAVMLGGDVGEMARVALTDGAAGLEGIGLEVLSPVRPMLATTAADLDEALEGMGEASVEWKLDGIRVQVHRSADDIRVYTRNLNDITDRVPSVVAAARALDAERFVLDGEAIGLGPDDRPSAFQDTVSMDGSLHLYLFDCLHLSGRDLVDAPLAARLERLREIAGHMAVPGLVVTRTSEGDRVLEDALTNGHEGVVVKDLTSTYSAGRRGRAWRKVKPHHTFDLVVLGAEWGHGRRRGWLSNLHLGARDPSGGFVMVGKTFKGLTDELLEWQTEALLARESHREGITVFVRSELVVEIALDGVQRSTRYPGGVALRFARVKRYRPDKDPADADTIEEVRALLAGRSSTT